MRQLLMASAGKGVGDQRKRVAAGAVGLCDGPTIRDKTIGANWCGRNAASLEEDPVQHTAG